MNKPEQYIMDGWSDMCEDAVRHIEGSCPLLEDEVVLEINEYMLNMECRINNLETILSTIID